MKNIIKVCLIASAFAFVVGCSTKGKPSTHVDSVSNAHSQVTKGTHPAQKCHGKKCVGKLGTETYTGDTSK